MFIAASHFELFELLLSVEPEYDAFYLNAIGLIKMRLINNNVASLNSSCFVINVGLTKDVKTC